MRRNGRIQSWPAVCKPLARARPGASNAGTTRQVLAFVSTVGALPREGGNLRARKPYQLCITGPTRRVPHAVCSKAAQNSAAPETFCQLLQHKADDGKSTDCNRPQKTRRAAVGRAVASHSGPLSIVGLPAKRSVRRTSNRSKPEPSTAACAITSLRRTPNRPSKQYHGVWRRLRAFYSLFPFYCSAPSPATP